MWRQSLQNVVKLPPMDKFGWTITDSTLNITWESQANTEAYITITELAPMVLHGVVAIAFIYILGSSHTINLMPMT